MGGSSSSNTERLHALLNYLPPVQYWADDPDTRIEERKQKVKFGRKRCETINRERLQQVA